MEKVKKVFFYTWEEHNPSAVEGERWGTEGQAERIRSLCKRAGVASGDQGTHRDMEKQSCC